MESQRSLAFLLVIFMGFLCSSQAYKFYVGGKDGWVLHPSESYNHWAERMRFQVNDSLIFKYRKGSDSVLVVTEDDYRKCNTKKPIKALKDGNSVFKFDKSGPFFFISGSTCNCQEGQKLIVVVMAVRNHHDTPSPVAGTPGPSPPPAAPPKSPSPLARTPRSSPPLAVPPTFPQPVAQTPRSSPPLVAAPTSPPPVAKAPVSLPPKVAPPVASQSPKVESPVGASPGPSVNAPEAGAPGRGSPTSSSPAFTASAALALGFSVGLSMVLGSFVGFF